LQGQLKRDIRNVDQRLGVLEDEVKDVPLVLQAGPGRMAMLRGGDNTRQSDDFPERSSSERNPMFRKGDGSP